MIIIGLLVGDRPLGQVVFTVVGCFWMVVTSLAGSRTIRFPCPRCGNWFFRTTWRYNGLARRCLHCGLPKSEDAERDPNAAPATESPEIFQCMAWYATESCLHRWMKIVWYDDTGSIERTDGGLRFVGGKQVLAIPRDSTFELIGPVIPWGQVVSLAWSNVTLLLVAGTGIVPEMTLDTPFPYLFLGFMDVVWPTTWPLKWVKAEYRDENGQLSTAYFRYGSVLIPWMGGGKRMYDLI